jgi:tol-pal system protein YbgF
MAAHERLQAGAALVAAAGLSLLAACAPQLDRIEVAVQENRSELTALRAENRRLTLEVQSLANLLRLESSAGGETDAQRFAKLGQVSQQIEQLLQKLDDNQAFLRDLSARVDLLATRSGIPTLGEYKPPPPREEAGLADLPEEGRSIYQAAQLDRSRGNLELAREGFRDFLERFPRSGFADDARYWLGDLAYGEGEWSEADAQFARLLQDHPQTSWAPAALLKRGYSLRELRRGAEAEAVFRELVTRYPASNEAALIRDQVD